MEKALKRDMTEGTGHALVALGDRGGPGARESEKAGPSGRGRSGWHDSRQQQERQQQHQQQEATGISAESSNNCNNHIRSSGGNNSCSDAVVVVVGEDRGSRGTLENQGPGEAVQGISIVVHRRWEPGKMSTVIRSPSRRL